MSNKSKIKKMSPSNHVDDYQTRIMFHRLRVSEQGKQIPIHQFLSRNKLCQHTEIMVFPGNFKRTIHTKNDKQTLFHVLYRDLVVPITLYDIQDYESVTYWCGFSDVTTAEEELRFAKWQLHKPTNDEKDMFITVSGVRRGKDYKCAMVAFGIYDVLPNALVDKATRNNWRITIGQPDLDNINLCEQANLYTNRRLAYMLMNIPVIFYSISKSRINQEEKHFVDVRDLEKTQLLHMHGDLLYGSERASQSPLDMFDAMLAFGKCWKVSSEIIYLPSLPRPRRHNRNELTELRANLNVHKNSLIRLENIFSHLTRDNKEEILRKQFPFATHVGRDVLEEELLKRLKTSYFPKSVYGCDESAFAPGGCVLVNAKLFASLPRPVAY